jgi:hypothetical protein
MLSSRFAREGEHKLVTVMFCDIANSTPLAARVGGEAMHSLLNRFFDLALAQVTKARSIIFSAMASWRYLARRWRTRITRATPCSRQLTFNNG